MAGTYKLIASSVLGSAANAVTFSSIPNTYTDLVIRMSARANTVTNFTSLRLQVNDSTNNDVSWTNMYGTGAAALSDANNGVTQPAAFLVNVLPGTSTTNNVFNSVEMHIPNYAGSAKKVIQSFAVTENNSSSTNTRIAANAALIQATDAVTKIRIDAGSNTSVQFVAGSSFYLYGLESPAQQFTAKATGGDITTDGTYVYHTFRQSGTFTPSQSLSVDVLQIGGGGGSAGGEFTASTITGTGGGGSGGLLYYTGQSVSSAQTVTVGAGGSGNAAGSSSQFGSLTASTGGGNTGSNGASGGGGTGLNNQAGGSWSSLGGGTGTSGQGSNGGQGFADPAQGYPAIAGGGGGGKAAAGGTASAYTAGAGGAGVSTYSAWGQATLTGQNVSGTWFYAGGGGGGANGGSPGAGGNGGGGAGKSGISGFNGLGNTGGGGGGSGTGSSGVTLAASNGGSGVVIVRYVK